MVGNILSLANGKKTVKDHIISVLSQEWPLSLKRLYMILRKKYQLEVSYQACHKAVKELVGQELIEKNDKEYQLNMKWVRQIKEFGQRVEEKYKNHHTYSLSSDDVVTNMIFNSMYEVDRFLLEISEKYIQTSINKRPTLCLYWCHSWVPLFFEKETYKRLLKVSQTFDIYSVIKNDTFIDNWCKDFVGDLIREETGINLGVVDFLILGDDIVVEIFYSENIKKEIHDRFSKIKDISDLNVENFFEDIFEKKTMIPVVVIKNKELAKNLKSQIMNVLESSNHRKFDTSIDK